jgi:hypothetical protein
LSILIKYSTRETPKIDNIIDSFLRLNFDYCLVILRNDINFVASSRSFTTDPTLKCSRLNSFIDLTF